MKGPDPRRAPRGLGSSQPPSGRLRHEGFSARGARGDEDGTTGEAPPRRPERGGPRPLPALSTHTGRRGGDERDPVRARRAPIRTPPSAARGPPTHTPTSPPHAHASPRPPNPNPDARGNPPFPARDHMRAPIPNPPTGRRWVPQGTDGKRRGGREGTHPGERAGREETGRERRRDGEEDPEGGGRTRATTSGEHVRAAQSQPPNVCTWEDEGPPPHARGRPCEETSSRAAPPGANPEGAIDRQATLRQA